MNKINQLLERKIKRLELALEEAESLLEHKSRELYHINKNLENEVKIRTHDLQIARDEAVKANYYKSQFLANMSHEIRTPLNGIIGFVNLLLQTPLSAVQKEHLTIVRKSGDFLLQIISDILEFSKVEAGKLNIDSKPFHLKRCIENLVDTISVQAFEKDLGFSLYLDEGIPKFLVGDEGRIRQVLINLIGNAIKYTPSGEIGLTVTSQTRDSRNFQLTFVVHDTGVGIPPDKLDSIFQPFEQADVSDTRKYGGTGLGLTISKQIAEAMGGKLTLESKEAVGTTFCFSVSLSISENEQAKFTTRDLKFAEAVAIVSSNPMEIKGLKDRLCWWKAKFMAFESIEAIDWSFAGDLKRNIIFDTAGCTDITKIIKLLQNGHLGAHLILISAPNEIANVHHFVLDSSVDLLRKPVARKPLFDSIDKKTTLIKKREIYDNSRARISPEKDFGCRNDVKVLVVEDNLINQQLILAILQTLGLRAEVVSDGRQAVDRISVESFDLVFMDCQMPVMDGLEATKNIRTQDKNLVIIALTANAYKQTKEACFEAGMTDFLTKPVKSQDIESILKKYLLFEVQKSA